METAYALVLTTVATDQQAGELARSIVSAGLAACVQIQSLRSVYKWKGEVRTEPEWLLLIKTTNDRYASLEQHIKAHHSYETPEIVKLPITGGSREYLGWIDECLGCPPTSSDKKFHFRSSLPKCKLFSNLHGDRRMAHGSRVSSMAARLPRRQIHAEARL